MASSLPFSQACENNKQPILDELKPRLKQALRLLEIGSGTGQHGAFFAANLPALEWQMSDLAANLPHLRLRQNQTERANLPTVVELDVTRSRGECRYDAIFSANTLHIMPGSAVPDFFLCAASHLHANGTLFVYGPFRYQGEYTSESNREFDQFLQSRDPLSGLREMDELRLWADNAGLSLLEDLPMPANNRMLVFKKSI
ncbi:class I SAM-dependent methyltransferase [Shewanella submarina]|uniref:DUF938 domain-containing protein n=1 Tax=Shewanella submarina TaxID=2016376 RepID=A0ABV7GDY5_9GAMM|nr:DUF938 domain-containing protein [Shewanella submarina]MCL1039731.1 class I SAM-dependent methyltransferase [Shewanella submarina]